MKNKTQNPNANFLPPFAWNNSNFASKSNKENAKTGRLGSVMMPPSWVETATETGHFSHDISRMADSPPKYTGHRRARSEIVTLLDDLSFDSDLGIVSCFSGEETDDHTPPATPPPEKDGLGFGDGPKVKHQYSMSFDYSTMYNSEDMRLSDARKSMSAAKLTELAIVDPKRAKRIWANRQSAARSKERKMRYITELEREVQIMQTEATSLSAQLTLLQREVHNLAAENNELKMGLQTMEQQVHLQDALTDASKEEILHLNLLTGQYITNGGPVMNFPPLLGKNQQFYPNNQAMHMMLTPQQLQQHHIQPRNQHHHHPFQPPQLRQFQNQQLHQSEQHHQRNLG